MKKKETEKTIESITLIEDTKENNGPLADFYKECDEYNSDKAVAKRKRKKFWNIFGDVIFGIVMVVLCYAIVVVNLAKQKGEVPFVGGFSIEYVETGSMEPTLPTGCVILAKKVDDSTVISLGDIITFYQGYDRTGEAPEKRVVVTHRVYSMFSDEETGVEWYTTKGDNNNAPDQYPILFSDIIATFVRRIY